MSVVHFSLMRKAGDGACFELSPTTDSRDVITRRGPMAFASSPTITVMRLTSSTACLC